MAAADWGGIAGNRHASRPAQYKCLLPAVEFLRSRDKVDLKFPMSKTGSKLYTRTAITHSISLS